MCSNPGPASAGSRLARATALYWASAGHQDAGLLELARPALHVASCSQQSPLPPQSKCPRTLSVSTTVDLACSSNPTEREGWLEATSTRRVVFSAPNQAPANPTPPQASLAPEGGNKRCAPAFIATPQHLLSAALQRRSGCAGLAKFRRITAPKPLSRFTTPVSQLLATKVKEKLS